MYVWLGIDLDSQLQQFKNNVCDVKGKVGLPQENANFPMHLSLKISFQIDDELFPRLAKDLCAYYKRLRPFDVEVAQMECHPNISWILYKPCQRLMDISIHLNDFLLANYGVPLHEYDTDFKYHTTLFMDDDGQKVATAYDMVKNLPLPQKVKVNTFCVGTSSSGELYTYQVCKRVVV